MPLADEAEDFHSFFFSFFFPYAEHDSQWEHLVCLIMEWDGCYFHVQRNTLHQLALCVLCTLWKSANHYERCDVLRCKTRVVNARCVGCHSPVGSHTTTSLFSSEPGVLLGRREGMLMWGCHNGPEVTGELMRETKHWNVFCTLSFSAHANDCKMEAREQGVETGNLPQRRLGSLLKTESGRDTDLMFPC